jgi:ATP-binding cassette subfamily B protein
MKYALNKEKTGEKRVGIIGGFRALAPLLLTEKKRLWLAMVAIVINSALTLAAPMLIGYTIDQYIVSKEFHGVLVFSGILLALYLGALVSSYFQTKLMGTVGQRALFNMRNAIFNKLQSLPISFFNQNKAGDLISRINNDTDKLNQFLSQSLVQFIGSVFVIIGAGIFIVVLNYKKKTRGRCRFNYIIKL